MAAISGNAWIIGVSIAAVFLLAFLTMWRLINLADLAIHKQSLLEGPEFRYRTQQIILGTKAESVDSVKDRAP